MEFSGAAIFAHAFQPRDFKRSAMISQCFIGRWLLYSTGAGMAKKVLAEKQ